MTRESSVAAGATTAYPPRESRIQTIPVMEKVPGRIIPARGAAGPIRVTLQRFMGVLVHPVPAIEMDEQCGVFQAGGKVYLDWPRETPDWFRVEAGDRLEADDRAFTIVALDEVPVVYSALYVREVEKAGP